MEESSETLNPASNSNLRDLILQKLSAAREQKLKQNRSTNNLMSNKGTSPPLNSNGWEEEKQVLMSLFEKSQNLVSQIGIEKKNLEAANGILQEKLNFLYAELEKSKGNKADRNLAEDVKKLEGMCSEKDKRIKEDARKIAMFEEKLQELYEGMKEKDKELEKLRKAVRGSKGFSEKVAQNLQEMKIDKEKLEKQEKALKNSPDKEMQLLEEVNKQKILVNQLRESKENKEKELKERIFVLTQENLALRKRNEGGVSSEEGYPAENELQKAYETISNLEMTLEKLKEDPKSPQKVFQDFYTQQKSIDDLHFSELIKKNAEITTLHNEIADLRHKFLVFESKKYENELILVRTDLHKAIAERVHAKKLLICYIRSVQQLEKMLNDRMVPGESSQVHELEISRLNEENKSLVEANSKQESFFVEEIRKLQEKIDFLNEKNQELENKVDICQKLRIKENSEEMKSWIIRNKQLNELNKRFVEGQTIDTKPVAMPKKRGSNAKESVKIH